RRPARRVRERARAHAASRARAGLRHRAAADARAALEPHGGGAGGLRDDGAPARLERTPDPGAPRLQERVSADADADGRPVLVPVRRHAAGGGDLRLSRHRKHDGGGRAQRRPPDHPGRRPRLRIRGARHQPRGRRAGAAAQSEAARGAAMTERQQTASAPPAALPPRAAGPWRALLRSLGRSPRVLVGGAIVAILVVCALFAPLIAPQDPNQQDLLAQLLPPVWGADGVAGHLLGTDNLGRDTLSRLIYGARV